MITQLIDKQDNFEVVRDQLGAIMLLETTNQQALAAAADRDPNKWKLRVYTEASNPWEVFLNTPVEDRSPIVNIWYDNSSFDAKASNSVERQKADAVFNIDCYGYGVASDIIGGGHTPGDQEAALEVQRALRLVRNIIMAGGYTYLGLRGLVWSRWPQSVTVFQPQMEERPVQNVVGGRLALNVAFNEFSLQYVPETLDLLSINVNRSETGELYFRADYDYTITP